MDGMLSQEEINALLGGMGQDESEAAPTSSSAQQELLTDQEKDAIGEISNISMGTAATTLSTLVNQRVLITTPVVSYSDWENLSLSYDKPCVFIQISYREGLAGNNILILKEQDVKVITDLMMGGDGSSNLADELSELHLSAISEAMNQMMGSASTSLSSMIERKVDISPPSASLIDMNDNIHTDEMTDFRENSFVKVAFKMQIGELVDSEIMQLYPYAFARDLYNKFNQTASETEVEQPVAPSQPQPVQPMMEQTMGMPQMQQASNMNMGVAPQMAPNMGMPPMQQVGQMPMGQMQMPYMQDVNVQPAQFQPFNQMVNPMLQQENIDLIMDVPLEVTVELGRTSKSIKEILDFAPGTIIELNKLAGEPIDVLVNGKFVAKGEVVVIEESFGIRVTEIIK